MEVRTVETLADARAVCGVRARAWRAAYADVLPEHAITAATDGSEFAPGDLLASVRDRSGEELLACEVDGAIRAFAVVAWDSSTSGFVGSDEAEVRAIYVDPEWWGRGVGSRVLARGVETVPDDVDAVALETFTANDRARRFYEARGFAARDSATVTVHGVTRPTTIYVRTR